MQTDVYLKKNHGKPIFCNNCWYSVNSIGSSAYTRNYILRNNLKAKYRRSSFALLQELTEILRNSHSREIFLILSELSYLEASKNPAASNQLYLSSAFYAYNYIFDNHFEELNFFAPEFNLARQLYNHSLSQLIKIAAERKVEFDVPTKMMMLKGQVNFDKISSELHWAPESYDQFFSAYDFITEGFIDDSIQHGLGVPLIVTRKKDVSSGNTAENYLPPLQVYPVSGFLRFKGSVWESDIEDPVINANIELYDPFNTDSITINDFGKVPLETNFSVSFAFLLNQDTNVTNLTGLLDPGDMRKNKHQGIYSLTPFNPDKIPVILVHGLVSTLRTWDQMYNSLIKNPEIRKKYQLFAFSYPSGLGIFYAAHLLREALHQFQREYDPKRNNPNFNKSVIIGHSLGGLLSILMLKKAEREIVDNLLTKSPEEFELEPDLIEFTTKLVEFDPVPFINRAILIGAPHRGSAFSLNAFSRFSNTLIEIPPDLLNYGNKICDYLKKENLLKEGKKDTHLLTGIESVSSANVLLDVIEKLKISEKVTIHSIIGNTKGADIPGGTDTIVPYESSHIDCAVSEKIIKSDHKIHKKPEAILEVERILLEHLKQ